MPHIRVQEYSGSYLCLAVHSKPKPKFLNLPHVEALTATACGECGYTELYANNPSALWDAYEKGKAQAT